MHVLDYLHVHTVCNIHNSLMVSQVNEYLDDLAMSNTKKDRAGMRKALQLLLRNTSALEQKWLIRIILKVHVQLFLPCLIDELIWLCLDI